MTSLEVELMETTALVVWLVEPELMTSLEVELMETLTLDQNLKGRFQELMTSLEVELMETSNSPYVSEEFQIS